MDTGQAIRKPGGPRTLRVKLVCKCLFVTLHLRGKSICTAHITCKYTKDIFLSIEYANGNVIFTVVCTSKVCILQFESNAKIQ